MESPRALVTGITGQDGIYLARHLLAAGWQVTGTCSPGSAATERAAHYVPAARVLPVDLRDGEAMAALLDAEQPDHVYNLAALTSVGRSLVGAGGHRGDERHGRRRAAGRGGPDAGAARARGPVLPGLLGRGRRHRRGQSLRAGQGRGRAGRRGAPRAGRAVRLLRGAAQPREPAAQHCLRHPQDHPRRRPDRGRRRARAWSWATWT
ncbi:NAD-dependent epimerase/dehydratase family protein [Nocardioides sp. W3-2-3]|uniref:GDP-mannose 4,6-dehydratase n=1 Tax=Nocardioides convexus TaxID=2712224 RepID=UPI00241869C3|nr:GDP-mannose 4,6-dehydratase [Nocardioides convexus]NHA01526.1 NAD-dependent epimerase/dehydratase family protein [Nocardioides convexus]